MGTRRPIETPLAPNQRWSLDFVSDQLTDGRRFRILAVVDDCTRECYGTEYTSNAILPWADQPGVDWHYIAPGKPQQNAYVERYNRTVRHEWLGQYIISSIEEAQNYATQWLWTYNNERPNMGIGGITPAQKLKRAASSSGNISLKARSVIVMFCSTASHPFSKLNSSVSGYEPGP